MSQVRTLQLIEVTVPRSPRLRTGGVWSWRHAVWFQKLNGIMPTKVCWKLWRFQKHRRLILCLGLFCRTTLKSTSYLHLPNLAFLAGPLPRPQWTLGSSQLLMLLFLTVLDHGHFWLQDLGGHCCDLSLWHHWYLIYRYYPHWGEMLPPNLWWGSIQTLFTFISCQWELQPLCFWDPNDLDDTSRRSPVAAVFLFSSLCTISDGKTVAWHEICGPLRQEV